ncbi:MAG: formyltetrahydrofolate deformylase [Actinomycetales bacterium]|nr:formyltetrahydrofolate deformylase [Actinomycetales bacterium]
MAEYILQLQCADTYGIIHAVASGLLDCDANIVEQAQFSDPDLVEFCLRTRFETHIENLEDVKSALWKHVERFEPRLHIRHTADRRRMVIMVSKFDHCLEDLLYHYSIGDLEIEIPAIVSNHEACRGAAEAHNLPFIYLPISPDTKSEQEAQLAELMANNDADYLILARYMQILSADFCNTHPGQIVNIHHSFLPGFVGAKPYHQAYQRGVKMIGATSHFVTADLDEGPIIDQDIQRVGHSQTPEKLVSIGRDVERRVLTRTVSLLAEDRIFLVGNRTIIFA